MKGNEEANEDEVVNEVDIFKTNLELHLFAHLIEFILSEVESAF